MENIRDIISKLELPNLSEYKVELIALLAAAAVTFFFYQFVYLRGISEIKRLDSQIQGIVADIEKISTEIKQTQSFADRLKEVMEKLKDMEERFMVTQSKLPSDKHLASLLKGLVDNDIKRGIKFTSLKPLPLEDKGEYFRLPFQITMQARFRPFGEYMERIEEMPRIVTVDNFRIDAEEEQSSLTIKLFMNTYVLGGQ